jgi:predicted MFS family arabinose efflux permease
MNKTQTHATEKWSGRIPLMFGHCAGMVNLVALPVWVGVLISTYQFDALSAGALATIFLLGAVVSNLYFTTKFGKVSGKVAAFYGFGIAACSFAAAAMVHDFILMAALNAIAGISAACGLGFVHGTVGRSSRPHQLFAITEISLGVFAVVFMALVPSLMAQYGGEILYWVFSVVMMCASLVCLLLFPEVGSKSHIDQSLGNKRFDSSVWLVSIGVGLMALVQAMMFSFLERIGSDRGFGFEAVTGVLVALGVVNLFPAGIAAFLEHRVTPRRVVVIGPSIQAVLALLMSQSTVFYPYAIGAMFFAAVMIFTHTFAFGLLAKLDPSGKAVSATPTMMMLGAAVGPILGGTLVKTLGYESLGWAALLIAALASICFIRSHKSERSLSDQSVQSIIS